ncbi:Xaa-Pro dipeptidase [Marinomonas sp. 15G1-11]|uniref:Xaa-Pro dipeptidase n=1 Tax=Marinomonas phaeophyticola TaxID=3004091 RepID=A0ABT4JSX0_9GAMM|nr:Xaa-Pro dipeptidase [Marinomonas sp. 15G1-11]MCZ2721497.1 Xaa-Pro dipeptidase [Marinomonas sp. 15G1-11]
MDSLYFSHIKSLTSFYQDTLERFQLDQIIIASGTKSYYFQDDYTHPFKPYAYAQQWLPFDVEPDTFIVISNHSKPTLIWPLKEDFWHAQQNLPEGSWSDLWTIKPTRANENWADTIKGKTMWLGQDIAGLSDKFGRYDKTLAWLDYHRAYKSDYEVDLLKQANVRALKGHHAAEKAFFEGKSELDIYLDYLRTSQQTSPQEPYSGIIALNQNAAVLHYEHKQIQSPDKFRTLLIDAGAKVTGYGSDITRTFTTDNNLFNELLCKMDQIQQSLANKSIAGTDYKALHATCLTEIANLLQESQICSLSAEEQISKGITQTFFPHGLGHLLGLQVHDVGGHQVTPEGDILKPPSSAPFLRLTRKLEENMVITIEPGLYFIPMLLEKMQQSLPQHGCDMALIKTLIPFGGIRIEDNVLVKQNISENLTRNS